MSPKAYVYDRDAWPGGVSPDPLEVPLSRGQQFGIKLTGGTLAPGAHLFVSGVADDATVVKERLYPPGPWFWPHPHGIFQFIDQPQGLQDFSFEVWVCPLAATPTPTLGPSLPCVYSSYSIALTPTPVTFTNGNLFEVIGAPVQVEQGGQWFSLAGIAIWNEPSGVYQVRSTGLNPSQLKVCVGLGTPTITPIFATATPDPNAVGLSFTVAGGQVGEAAGRLVVTVRLSRPQRDPIAVNLSTTSWTAMVGADLQSVITTLVFVPGETHVSIAIPIIDDLLPEGDEIFHVRLSEPRRELGLSRVGGVLAHPALQTVQPQAPVLLGWPAVFEGTIIDDDLPQPTIPAEVCVMVLPTATPHTPTPFPTLPLAFPTFRPLPPQELPSAAPGAELTATAAMTQAQTIIAEIVAPAATVSAWSATAFPEGGAAKGREDAALLTAELSKALGWLAIFGMLGGPIAAMLPAIFIQLYVRIARGLLRLLRYIRLILPR